MKVPIAVLMSVLIGSMLMGGAQPGTTPTLDAPVALKALGSAYRSWSAQIGQTVPVTRIVLEAPRESLSGEWVLPVEMESSVGPRLEPKSLSLELPQAEWRQ